MHIIEKIDVKKILLYFLILLFSYSISGAVFKIMAERTIGSIFRHLMTTTPYLLLIILVSMYDVGRFSFASLIPSIPTNINLNLILKRYSWILLIAVIIGFLSSIRLINLGLLYVPVIIFVIGSLIISCYCMISEKRVYSIVMLMAAIPFLFFIQREHGRIGFGYLTISELTIPLSVIYLIIIFLFFLVANSSSKMMSVSRNERYFLSLFGVLALVSIFPIIFSKDPYHSVVYYFLTIIIPFIYFYILLKSINSINDIKIFITALIFSVFFFQFFALYYRYQMGGIESVTTGLAYMEDMRFLWFGFSVILIPLVITYQIAMYNLNKGWIRTAFGFSFLFLILFLILKNNRSSSLGILTCLIVFVYYYRTSIAKKTYFFIAGLLSLVLMGIYSPVVFELLQLHRLVGTFSRLSVGESVDIISSNRIDIWHAAINMIRDFFIFGIGPGMWETYIPQYSLDPYFYQDVFGILIKYYSIDPHNIYLLMWLDYGLIGFICFLAILYTIVKIGVRTIKSSSSMFIRKISIASLASIIAFMVMGLFTLRFIGQTILLPIVFWSIIAIILKLNEFNFDNNFQRVD